MNQVATEPLGKRCWVIPEGYLPSQSHGPQPQMTSHGTMCVLNTSDVTAQLQVTIYFSDRDPVGPYSLEVSPQRTQHIRFNDLQDPAPIPRDTDFATVIRSSVPVVVQHTRLDSRQAENALLSTLAYASDGS